MTLTLSRAGAPGLASAPREGLFHLSGPFRTVLWVSLLSLTAGLLLFPTRLTVEYRTIQSISAIPDLPVFAAFYIVWLGLLLTLLVSGGESQWEKPALVAVFAVVFLGFWLMAGDYTSLRYDGIFNAAHVDQLAHQPDGTIPVGGPKFAYFNFPGMHLFAFFLVEITGIALPHALSLLLLTHLALVSVLAYLLFLRGLHNPSVAALGSLLFLQGNIILARYAFYPGVWALALLAMFLVLINKPGTILFSSWQDRLLMLLLLAAATMTHFVTAILLFFVLAGIYLVRSMPAEGRSRTALVSLSTLTAFLVIPLSWDVYWATHWFQSVAKVTSAVISDFTEKGSLLYLFNLGGSYAGGAVPLWALAVRYFWWATIFVLGGFLGLRNLLRFKTLSRVRQLETGGLMGVAALSAAVTGFSVGGSEFYRFLLYGPFFTIPILLRPLLDLSGKRWKVSLGLAAVSFFALSFPTFLSHNNLVGTSAYYSYEFQAGRFLEQAAPEQERLRVFSLSASGPTLLYTVPNADLRRSLQAAEMKDPAALWQARDDVLAGFLDPPRADGRLDVFYRSVREAYVYQNIFNISPQDPEWRDLDNTLSRVNRLYDNGEVQIYGR